MKETLKEKLSSLKIKISELSQYLSISRPTLYKYIELYEDDKYDEINTSILKLFDYIMDNPYIDKNNVIVYILNNIANVKIIESDDDNFKKINTIKKYLTNNPTSKKAELFYKLARTKKFDDLVDVFLTLINLMSKKTLSNDETIYLDNFKNILNKSNKFSDFKEDD